MLDVRRRPEGRLFYWLLSAVLVFLVWSGVSVPVAMASPATTRVSDIVYRADGSVASGVVLISWPAFTAADGTPVAAGSTSVALGNDGSLNVDLIPNAGAVQSGIYYTAVFQLDEVRWSDASWGQSSDRNLAARFTTRTFTLPRLGRVEDYYVRQYDGSSPAKYSRYSAALHLDYPL